MNRRQFIAGLMATAATPKIASDWLSDTRMFPIKHYDYVDTWRQKVFDEVYRDIKGLVDQLTKTGVIPSSVVMTQEAFDELQRYTPMVLERTPGVFTLGDTVVRIARPLDPCEGTDGENAREETETDV